MLFLRKESIGSTEVAALCDLNEQQSGSGECNPLFGANSLFYFEDKACFSESFFSETTKREIGVHGLSRLR